METGSLDTFLGTLNEKERSAYLKKWQPPNDEWKENITQNWVGKIRKTEDWFERQMELLENQKFYPFTELILLPWIEFPKIASEQTFWDEEFIDRWMREIWLPHWNSLSEEKQNKELSILKANEFPDEDQYRILANYEIENLHKFKD